MTPSSRRMLASMLLGNARQPVQHPLQAISNLANTYFGYKALGQADEAEKAKKLERSQAIANAFAPRSTSVPVVRHVGGHPGIDGRRVNLMENTMVSPNNKQIAQALLKIPGLETAAIGLMTKPPQKPITLGVNDRLVTPQGKVLATPPPNNNMFQGSSFRAQSENKLAKIMQRIQNNLPISKIDRIFYQRAMEKAKRPHFIEQINPETNVTERIQVSGQDTSFWPKLPPFKINGGAIEDSTQKGENTSAITENKIVSQKLPKLPSTAEAQVYGFYNRMNFSNKTLTELEKDAFDASGQIIEENSPFINMGQLTLGGAFGPNLGGYFQRVSLSEPQQLYLTAANNWVRANIREESGAAIPEEELRQEYMTYFPMPGDSAATIRLKAQSRKQTEFNMKTASRASINYEKAKISLLKQKLKGDELDALKWLEENPTAPKANTIREMLGII
tara:strand:- start:8955 stop:10298 length:1344 start_codon:yes stop_codon:yes gene_type:complete